MQARRTLAVFFAAISFATAAQGQATENDAELQRILSRMRETYATAPAWHFEHRVTIEETEKNGQAVKLADVSLITANRVSPRGPSGVSPQALCEDRCRLESKTAERGSIVVARDGTQTWRYSSADAQYMKGAALRDIASSVAGPMLLTAHLVPLMGLEGDNWQSVTLVGEETVEIGGERRDSYLVEAILKTSGMSLESIAQRQSPQQPQPPQDGLSMFSGPSGLVQLLQLSGFVNMPAPAAYFTTASVPPARLRLWIDKQRYLVLRRSASQTAAKLVPTLQPPADLQALPPTTEVTMRVDDTFSVARIADAVQDSIFTFNPPPGAREVPNIRNAPRVTTDSRTLPAGARELGRNPSVWAYYTQQPDTLTVTVEAPPDWSAAIAVDMNQDGKKEPPDVEFGKTTENRVCIGNVVSNDIRPTCGTSTTKATLQVRTVAGMQVMSWVLPKKELSADGRSARFEVWIWNSTAWSRLGGPYSHLVFF